uniref:BZIP transcription factor n=1 Tax=Phaeodactylum tricornutum TaxID=2850 RepID=F8WL64_PHATR|nr:bZIP transcription factor [Phaeodactylum tricornutum]
MSFSLPTTFHSVPHAGPQSFIRNHTASTPPPSEDMQTLEEEYSSVPGASVSSHSSPGSTADLKGTALPDPALVIFPTPPSHVPVHRQYHHHHSNNNASTSAGTSSSDSLSWHPSVPSVPVLVSAQHHPTPGAALPTASAPSGTALTVQKEPTNRNRRQKRLERNRESARLSRRRRKHYLEVLEEKVTQLSHAMDRGRRAHVAQANRIRQSERHEIVQSGNVKHVVRLETALSRTSRENSVTQTFRWQQLKSLCLPPSTKFVLWLTLQNDVYFRGGRAASERLSAARIGERMLHSGNDKVSPSQAMWPLLCNEVGLSYDQEEKVRAFQRTTLQDPQSWLNRHVAYASDKTMESVHDAAQALALRLGQREKATMDVLTPEQRIKFLAWSQRNRDRVANAVATNPRSTPSHIPYQISPLQHVAANLYVLNHKMQTVLETIPRAAPLVTGLSLKKLSIRPLFESLGCVEERVKGLCRDGSFASSGSLKRAASEMSIDDEERVAIPALSPEDAENTCRPVVDEALGHVADIIPPPPVPLPAPTPVSSMTASLYYAPPHAVASMPTVYSAPDMGGNNGKHARKSSFLPANLNVVPEELWPADAVADDFLMNLVDGDWAIGEGVEF